jgi:hydrogenase small subunit
MAEGSYVVILQGGALAREDAAYRPGRGRGVLSKAKELCGKALATIVVECCASAGSWLAEMPGYTVAQRLKNAVPGIRNLINMPGCPLNVVNLTAVFAQYATYGTFPECDRWGRPFFAYVP